MIVLPAIDLKDGAVVRLHKGEFHTVHRVADDPEVTARAFMEAGARYVHMVDLDGAKDGVRKNSGIVRQIAALGLCVELGGGIRTMDDLHAVFALGIYRAVIGSAAVSNPALVSEALKQYGHDRIAVGIDAGNGIVKTAGWTEDSGLNYLDFAREMEALGVKKIIFTDIETDGTLEGPSFERLAALRAAVNCDIIASGGVSCNRDIRQLRDMGMHGVIVGKAWYAGTVDLAAAISEGGAQC